MPDAWGGEDVSRRELEKQLAELRRDKWKIQDNIKRMESTQQRIFRDNEKEKAQPWGASKKRSRSASRHSDKEKKKEDDDKKSEDSDKEDKEDKEAKDDKEKEDKEPEKKRPAREGRGGKPDPRSRNIFGKMLGHLHSAKSRLENEKGSKQAELNQKAQERIEEKLSMSQLNIKEFRKSQFEKQRKEEEIKFAEISKFIEEKEVLLLQKRLESHYSLMMNFIRTKAEPTVFYLPAVHTKDSEHALEETRAAIKHKIASLKVQFQPTPEEKQEAEARSAAAAAAVAAAGEAPDKEEEADKDEKSDKEDDKAESDKEDEKDDDEKAAKPEAEKKQAPSDDEDDDDDDKKGDDAES